MRNYNKKWQCHLLSCLIIFISGCALIPSPIPQDEFEAQAQSDRQNIIANKDPVSGPVSLYEAIARALKYNLDFHLELANKVLAQKDLEISHYELLPQMVTNLGYAGRSNFSGAGSRNLVTGRQSLPTSTSSDRDIHSANLSLTWNVLDFGLSYFRAKQAADRVLLAEEEKRKVINRLVRNTRTAYWRAVSNDRLIEKMQGLLVKVNSALSDSRRIEAERLDRPLTALTYQRELIGIKREIEELMQSLSFAKIQLAALMNLSPGEKYDLSIPERDRDIKPLEISLQMLETIALENRPEVREISYQKRINRNESKAAILELLPGLNLNFGQEYNDNSFLFNNDWLNYGARISSNLINLLRLPSVNRQIDAREAVLDAQRLSVSMAVLSQVHVSIAQYEFARRQYQTAMDYYETQKKILEQISTAAIVETISQQTLIREEMNMLVAEMRYDIAYSDLQNSYAGIYSALGVDLLPGYDYLMPLETLENLLEKKFNALTIYDEIFQLKIE
jgi:outer membrane protein TolC